MGADEDETLRNSNLTRFSVRGCQELLCGAHYIFQKYNSLSELKQVEKILQYVTEVPVDAKIAWKAAEIRSKLLLKGIVMPDIDLLIACSAEDAEILTFDTDFKILEELDFHVNLLRK